MPFTTFFKENSQQSSNRRDCSQSNKEIYSKPTENILNGKKPDVPFQQSYSASY